MIPVPLWWCIAQLALIVTLLLVAWGLGAALSQTRKQLRAEEQKAARRERVMQVISELMAVPADTRRLALVIVKTAHWEIFDEVVEELRRLHIGGPPYHSSIA
jgi:hypothetical protein